MVALFRWFAAMNLIGTIVIVLSVLAGPTLFACLFLPSASVELQLVPTALARPAAAANGNADARPAVPAEFRPPDLSVRPWDEFPDGGVCLQD
ncbi:MAG: hypothetical protein FJX62_24655 [Alphaproteobacteria bacterium]|nr:hypothetical protein [Alphaproteobacteria bacterium]